MDLTDVIYIIDGSLEVVEHPDASGDGLDYVATLYDNIHDPCMVQGEGLRPEPGSTWRYAKAIASGPSQEQALEALVKRIAGNSLGHDWPVMWKSVTEWMRIPPTLVVGDVSAILNIRLPFKQEQPEETEATA